MIKISIRPLDIQITVNNASNVSKQTSSESDKSFMAQQHVTEKINKQSDKISSKVIKTHKSEKKTVDKDGKGNGGGQGTGRYKKNKDSKNKQKNFEDADSGSTIDFTV